MGNYNPNSGYGQELINRVASSVPVFGRIAVVKSSSDTADYNYNTLQNVFPSDADGRVRFFTSLSDAYDWTQTNNNDLILLDGHSNHVLTSGLDVSKSRIHFLGMDGGERLQQQGAKIWLTTAATTAYVMKNTGTRNTFKNIKFIQAATAGTGLTVIQDGSEGVLYKNCSTVFEVANNLGSTSAHEFVAGTDTATFDNCVFGNDTLLTSAARSVFHIDQVTAGQEFKSNILKDCTFMISSSNTGAQAIKIDAVGDILFSNHFIRPSFIASLDSAGGVALTRAVSTPNNTVKGTIYISYPMVHGFSDIGTNGTNNDNLYVFSHVPSAVDITSAQPTTT